MTISTADQMTKGFRGLGSKKGKERTLIALWALLNLKRVARTFNFLWTILPEETTREKIQLKKN